MALCPVNPSENETDPEALCLLPQSSPHCAEGTVRPRAATGHQELHVHSPAEGKLTQARGSGELGSALPEQAAGRDSPSFPRRVNNIRFSPNTTCLFVNLVTAFDYVIGVILLVNDIGGKSH